MAEKETASKSAIEDKGLSDQYKFSAKESPRGITNEESQRPTESSYSMKTDKGTFTFRGTK